MRTGVQQKLLDSEQTGLYADRIRVHTDASQNLRLVPTAGAAGVVDGMIAYAATDPGAGTTPALVGVHE